MEIYQLSRDYIQVNYAGKKRWTNLDGSTISYGGAQKWFLNFTGKYNDSKYNDKIKRLGCGLVSVADILLYLSMSNSKYSTEETNKVTDTDDSRYIEYKAYMKYLLDMERKYFHIKEHLGLLGTKAAAGIEKYSAKYHLGLKASWCMSKREILPRIKEMLSNDIPVMLSGDTIYKKGVMLYVWDVGEQSYVRPPDGIKNNFRSHYVTVTGLVIDDEKHETWLEVSSWGKRYFIDYDQYMDFIDKKSLPLFSNILYISKKEA